MKMGDIASAEEDDDPDEIPEGFHLQEESPHCLNMTESGGFSGLSCDNLCLEFEKMLKDRSDRT